MITGTTRTAGVIGLPIRHSLSPAIFNAAFAAAGLDWAYLAFEVPEGAAGMALGGMRALGIEGLSVTMPHKAAVVPGVDRLSTDADALGAVNCVVREGGELIGHNTDGAGLIDALRLDEGIEVAGRSAAVIRALAQHGATEVVVVNRSPAPAVEAAALAGGVGRTGVADELGAVDLVVNATPLGMGVLVGRDGAPEPLPVDPDRLGPGQIVVDLVYHPAVTPLLQAVRARRIRGINGVGMLIHQAAHAFRLWTKEEPPLEAMSAAALAALLQRERDSD
jgi:shikimate dehydrogenase